MKEPHRSTKASEVFDLKKYYYMPPRLGMMCEDSDQCLLSLSNTHSVLVSRESQLGEKVYGKD